jgi:hypothetical protein
VIALDDVNVHVYAQAARAVVEASLEANGWPWSRRLSLWLDALLVLEESQR